MKHYLFKITLSGYGKNADEAWEDAVESFSQDSGGVNDTDDIIEDTDYIDDPQLPETICQDGTIAK